MEKILSKRILKFQFENQVMGFTQWKVEITKREKDEVMQNFSPSYEHLYYPIDQEKNKYDYMHNFWRTPISVEALAKDIYWPQKENPYKIITDETTT